jgi:syntaxin-binding protein 1
LKDLTESLAKDILSDEEYPFVVPPPPDVQGAGPTSLRRKHGASKWTKSKKNATPELSRGRAIVFMAGGASYSEVRSVYEVQDTDLSREVLMGCTSLLTPEQYFRGLASLDGENSQGGVALHQLAISIEE